MNRSVVLLSIAALAATAWVASSGAQNAAPQAVNPAGTWTVVEVRPIGTSNQFANAILLSTATGETWLGSGGSSSSTKMSR